METIRNQSESNGSGWRRPTAPAACHSTARWAKKKQSAIQAAKKRMESFYAKHGLDAEECEKEAFKAEIFNEIMENFHAGLLTFKGKGGMEVKVTNPKQAYAIACSMSERAWKRRCQGET